MTHLTNAHTHLELGWLSSYCPGLQGVPFGKWISGIVKEKDKIKDTWLTRCTQSINEGIATLQSCGTTDVADICGTHGLSIEPIINSGLNSIVYIEVKGISPNFQFKLDRLKETIGKWRCRENSKFRLGLSIHSIYSTHPVIWSEALEYAYKERLPICIHAAESPEETEFALSGTGEIVTGYIDRYKESNLPVPNMSPIQYLCKLGALELHPLLIHCVQTEKSDIELIKKYGCTVVHCPRSNSRLLCGRMQLEQYLENDIPVFLGTDSLGSSPSLNILEEAEFASDLHSSKVSQENISSLTHKSIHDAISI